jgi:hypothetical protein
MTDVQEPSAWLGPIATAVLALLAGAWLFIKRHFNLVMREEIMAETQKEFLKLQTMILENRSEASKGRETIYVRLGNLESTVSYLKGVVESHSNRPTRGRKI